MKVKKQQKQTKTSQMTYLFVFCSFHLFELVLIYLYDHMVIKHLQRSHEGVFIGQSSVTSPLFFSEVVLLL